MVDNKTNKSFLGSGWSFPPRFARTAEGLELSHDDQDIAESIFILLSTQPGERVMNPAYGCDLQSQMFKKINNSTKAKIEDIIATAILYHEPRVNVVAINIDTVDSLKGHLNINIVYEIKGANSRKNMVYPFYLSEGSDI
jgi:phage baseplate assembly protein W